MKDDSIGTDDYQSDSPSLKNGYNPFITSMEAAESKRKALTKSDNFVGRSSIPSSKKIYGGQNGSV